MARRIKRTFPATQLPKTKIPKPFEPKEQYIKFIFKYFDSKHRTCKKIGFKQEYPKKLLDKLKEFEGWTVKEFKTQISDQHYRIHQIKWGEPRVAFSGFGLNDEYDAEAWQFSISKKYGRVCGFFIDNLFYIVWLDPNHMVYPTK